MNWVSATRGSKYYFVTYLLDSYSQHAKEKCRKIVSFYNLFSKILLNKTKHLYKTLLAKLLGRRNLGSKDWEKKNLKVDNASRHAPEQIDWKAHHNNFYFVTLHFI